MQFRTLHIPLTELSKRIILSHVLKKRAEEKLKEIK